MTTTSEEQRRPLNLDEFRQNLAGKKNKVYWRSLNELANHKDFEEIVRQEFPRQAGLLESLNRRDFLKVLGASLALAGLAACAPRENEKIVPYVKPPEELVPAKSIYYASAMVQDGYAKGVLIETTMGRPIKVEGLPGHPDSQGSSDAFMQASLLDLYDPDRVKQVIKQVTPSSWKDFTAALGGMVGQGEGLRILTGTVTSPSLSDQLTALLAQFPQAKWVSYNPVSLGNAQAGAMQAFGRPLSAVYDLRSADVIVSLDCDFLLTEPGHLRYSRDFIQRHQPVSSGGTMSRLYVVEPGVSLTGSNADHRLAVKPAQIEAFAQALAAKLGVSGAAAAGDVPGQDWLDPLVADLRKAGAAALIVAGERQPAVVHALALAMNQVLGSIGKAVTLVPPIAFAPADPALTLNGLVDELNGGQVNTLVILEGNPVYTAPVDLAFGEAMKKAKQSIYLAFHADETAAQATWTIPATHYMEMWGDARAFDGTVSLIQPVIEPLYEGKSPYELLAALRGQADAKGMDVVRGYWQTQLQAGNFDRDWLDILSKGMLPNSALAADSGALEVGGSAFAASAAAGQGMTLVFEPDPTVWDGRFSNNAWLQELPKPVTKLTWDNAALVSPQTAAKLGVTNEDLVNLKLRGKTIQAPIYLQPGLAEDVVVISLGYGRKTGGKVLEGAGFNAYALRSSEAPWFDSGLEVSKAGGTHRLAATHEHWSMENRDLVRSASLEEYQANPNFAHKVEGAQANLYGEGLDNQSKYAWGMSINLSACIGCNACVVACQAENNIPTVGKDQVLRGREMHWLRIDRYYEGGINSPHVFYEPVPCMHCEKAPCEPVCPVEATSHSVEGINEMTYNRCVGTKYCSNNCPYKVRRFNFYKYADDTTSSLRPMRNPDVTVRNRGVMEKCTYCIQRVNQARIQAEVEGRDIQDNEVLTACQQACPTHAIIFGNINDNSSQVRKLKESPLNYGLLEDLGTQPRTTYLARVTNPNPMIPQQG
jgi:MoCo/4Fe-4S cofactor protein with predicted Tat translocation signal